MAAEILLALLASVHFGQCDIKCWKDNTVDNIDAIKRDAFVVTLPEKNLCIVLGTETNLVIGYEDAGKLCRKFADGAVMKQENIASLKVALAKYPDFQSTIDFYAEKESSSGNCPVFHQYIPTRYIGCYMPVGFACQYQYQKNCFFEIAAIFESGTITYRVVISQNSDVTGKLCSPNLPQPIACADAKIVEWGAWGACGKSCEPDSDQPPVKSRSQEVTCSGKGPVTLYNNVTCNNYKAECEEKAATTGTLFIVVMVCVVVACFLIAAIIAVFVLRRRNRQPGVGKFVGGAPAGSKTLYSDLKFLKRKSKPSRSRDPK